MDEPQHLPQGALRQADGSVLWRVWAPLVQTVTLVTWPDDSSAGARRRVERPMTPEAFGYHVLQLPDVEEGLRYAYRLADDKDYPDPASRWQPDGVHRPSAVFSFREHAWSDQAWQGVSREDLVLYELHVGTFTPEGTFEAITARLGELKSLGVTAVELMPVAQFPGDRNWGYDGVHLFAAQNTYGGPIGLARLVDAAHQEGMAVFLDVVYNHFGPEGNYLGQFGPYFTGRYHTPWGNAVNFDGPDSDAVRQLVIDNACMWVRDFHVDGLRLDAVHAIYDFGPRHILADVQAAVRQVSSPKGSGNEISQGRAVHVIAESHSNDVRLVDPPERGGYGLDGVWSDDFHHSVRAVLSGQRDGYYRDFGRAEHLAKALGNVFVYDGCYSPFWRRRWGTLVEDRDRTRFVVCIHNHDQVGNRVLGDRPAASEPPAAGRLAAGLLALSPCVPLLFMGEEYGETRPFPFFCSFGDPDLVEAVRRGRWEEFAAMEFEWQTSPGGIPDPQDPQTFASAKLTWQWPEGTLHAQMRRLYADLLKARRDWPPLRDRRHTTARLVEPDQKAEVRGERLEVREEGRGKRQEWSAGRGEPSRLTSPLSPLTSHPSPLTAGPSLLVIERSTGESLLAVANLTAQVQPLSDVELEGRVLLLSTEDQRYGGARQAPAEGWSDAPPAKLDPYELLMFGNRRWMR